VVAQVVIWSDTQIMATTWCRPAAGQRAEVSFVSSGSRSIKNKSQYQFHCATTLQITTIKSSRSGAWCEPPLSKSMAFPFLCGPTRVGNEAGRCYLNERGFQYRCGELEPYNANCFFRVPAGATGGPNQRPYAGNGNEPIRPG